MVGFATGSGVTALGAEVREGPGDAASFVVASPVASVAIWLARRHPGTIVTDRAAISAIPRPQMWLIVDPLETWFCPRRVCPNCSDRHEENR